MVLQDDNTRVSNPPPPHASPSLLKTVDSSALASASAAASGSRAQQPKPQHALTSNHYIISNRYAANRLQSSFVPGPAHSSSASVSQPGVFGIQSRISHFGGGWIDTHAQSQLNGSSRWNAESQMWNNPDTNNHTMAILRNRSIGLPPLAPAPAPRKPGLVTKTLIEASQPSLAQEQLQLGKTKTDAQASTDFVSSLANTPNDAPVATGVQAQQLPNPLSMVGPTTIPTIAPQQKQTLASTPLRKTPAKSHKRRNRRKRAHDSDDEIKARDSSSDGEESDDTLPVARQTKSGRQVNRPSYFAPSPEPKPSPRQRPSPSTTPASGAPAKRRRKVYRKNGKDINITCRHCQRGHSPVTNSIVFCDECNGAWHQFCHDPPISKQLIDVKEAEWFCRECRPGQRTILLKLRLPQKPMPVPSGSSLVPLVSGSQFTTEEQRGYLSSLSHATLVDMLVTLSNTNPTLPVFPENLKDLTISKFAVAPSNKATSKPQQNSLPTSNGTAIVSESGGQGSEDRKEHSNGVESSGAKQKIDKDSDDSGSEYEVDEHRLYPRPGNGFCLPPEEDDLNILLEEPACPTFSYTLHSYPQANALADNGLSIQVAS